MEVIVVDDCSSDRTVSIAAGFPTDRVRVLALTENHGPGAARNAGLAAARGEWVAVLDADDTMLPGRLAAMIAPGRSLVGGDRRRQPEGRARGPDAGGDV